MQREDAPLPCKSRLGQDRSPRGGRTIDVWDRRAELPWQQVVSRQGTKRKRLTDRGLQADATCAPNHAVRSALCARPAQFAVFSAQVLLATHAGSNATAHAGHLRVHAPSRGRLPPKRTCNACLRHHRPPAHRPPCGPCSPCTTHPHAHGPAVALVLGRFLLTNLLLQTPTPPYPAMATVPHVPCPTRHV